MTTTRRDLLGRAGVLGGGAALAWSLPAWARSGGGHAASGIRTLHGTTFDLHIDGARAVINGREGDAVLVNGQLPAPLLRWREGDRVRLRVTNHLAASTSIHWHGILVPPSMDGVPGVSFPGIAPGETFTYEFPVRQAGTYWYHSHSGLQEQQGHYGPLVIDPAGDDPLGADREFVVVLSDWTFENPHALFAKLKKKSNVYNRARRTLADLVRDARRDGLGATLAERRMWGAMRMDPTDIADVTAETYSYLVNGHGSEDNWSGLFEPGERVRLRFINAAAMTIFNVRLPGLPMTVVQADGLDVRPVVTDEFQIGVAETFDVLVEPSDRAWAIVAEANDRSGAVRATLAPRPGMTAAMPPLRPRPLLTMKDMAMAHGGHGRAPRGHHQEEAAGHHGRHREAAAAGPQAHDHPAGPGVVGLAERPAIRLHDRPLGLDDVPHRVLVYGDLRSAAPNPDPRRPAREIELHLTGNMERYMWSFDGVKFSDAREPVVLRHGERVRLALVNDTMMPHPIHLHGMFFDLVTEEGDHKARKHTVVVKPGERLLADVTADALGDWAFHCHLLYHMHAGMMRIVSVRA